MYKKIEVLRGDVGHEIYVGNGDVLLDIMNSYSSDGKFLRALVNR